MPLEERGQTHLVIASQRVLSTVLFTWAWMLSVPQEATKYPTETERRDCIVLNCRQPMTALGIRKKYSQKDLSQLPGPTTSAASRRTYLQSVTLGGDLILQDSGQ